MAPVAHTVPGVIANLGHTHDTPFFPLLFPEEGLQTGTAGSRPPASGAERQSRGRACPDCSPAQDRQASRPLLDAPLCLSGSVCPGTGAFGMPQFPCPARPAAGHSGEEQRPGDLRQEAQDLRAKAEQGWPSGSLSSRHGASPGHHAAPEARRPPAPAWSQSHAVPTWIQGCMDLAAQGAGEGVVL